MIRIALLLLLVLCPCTVAAAEGGVGADDDALLVLSLQTDVALAGLRVESESGRERTRLGPFSDGIHLQLVALPPGRYRFSALLPADGDGWVALGNGFAEPFELRAATLSYPGDILLSQTPTGNQLQTRLSNRGARVWERLALRYPDLLAQLDLAYVGASPDPFPGFWRQIPRQSALPQPPPAWPDPEQGQGPTARDFLRARGIGDVSLSPDGRLLALTEADDGPLRLRLVDLQTRRRSDLGQTLRSDARLRWCAARCLAISSGGATPKVRILRLSQGSDWQAERIDVPVSGYVLDPLVAEPHRLLFAATDDPADPLRPFRLDYRRGRIDAGQFAKRRQLDTQLSDDLAWISDAAGEPIAALRRDQQRYLIQRRDARADWQTVVESTPERIYDPIAADRDGALLALSELDHDVRALVRTDLQNGTHQTVDAHPDHEPVGLVADPQRRPLAIREFIDNRLQSRALEPALAPRLAALQSRYGDGSFALMQVGAELPRWLYFTDTRAGGGQWWVQDEAAAEPWLVAANRPWLSADARSTTRSIRLHTAEGWPLEAVLVEPVDRTEPMPLVVMPHGGPIAVRDSRLFDPQAQYLASTGLAVLQVNFRGSAGYGRRFRLAAYGEAGGAIEDDIQRAVEKVLEEPRFDRRRVCAMGSSYGGYSSLMLAIRHPQLYRCVVALAPITDLPLRFSSSDWNDDPLQSAFQRRLYGDPQQATLAQMARSPLYRYAELLAPVLLGHGERDQRVDPEHSRRLGLVLARAGRPAFIRWYDNEAHGLRRADNLIDWMRHAAGFIHEQTR